MPLSNFPNGFPGGVTVQNLPILNTYSDRIFWVDSNFGGDGNKGTFQRPFATIAKAVSFCTAARGDVIMVKAGHAETITAAGALTINVAGVTILGLGTANGADSPTITFTTSTAATLLISAANVSISGLRFVNGIASQVTMLDVQGTGCKIVGNEFREGASTTGLSFIDLVNATANTADNLVIANNRFLNKTAGNYNHAIGLNTVHDNIEIAGNYIVGQFALSGIHNVTGKVVTNVNIHDNYVRNLTAAKVALNFISAVTGQAYRNIFEPGDATVNSAKFGTALDSSGGNRGINGFLDAGSEFWVKKAGIVSSTITQAGVDLTVASIGGAIAIKGGIFQTDATGLAGMTNFTIVTNNADGLLTFVSQAITALGANKTLGLGSLAGTTALATAGFPTVLESGKKLTLKATAADGTGAGLIDIYLLCQRLTAGADLSLA